VARHEHVGGVIAACTDVAVPTAAIVSERLGLAGNDVPSAHVVTSKLAFRRWQRENSLPSPAADDAADLDGLPGRGPWIVKPDRSSGSKGIRIVNTELEFADALAAANEHGTRAVVEEALHGQQLTVEGLVRDGRLAWSILLDRQTAPPPFTATMGHRVPSQLDEAETASVLDAVDLTIAKLGLRDGPIDVDLVLADEPVVLELSPRLGGNSIARLVRLATGLNLVALAIDTALGRSFEIPAPALPTPTAVVLLGTSRAGALQYAETGLAQLRAADWVEAIELAPLGTRVRPFVDGRAVIGRAFVRATDREGLDERVAELQKRLAVAAA
jgi:biotin carboxylase